MALLVEAMPRQAEGRSVRHALLRLICSLSDREAMAASATLKLVGYGLAALGILYAMGACRC